MHNPSEGKFWNPTPSISGFGAHFLLKSLGVKFDEKSCGDIASFHPAIVVAAAPLDVVLVVSRGNYGSRLGESRPSFPPQQPSHPGSRGQHARHCHPGRKQTRQGMQALSRWSQLGSWVCRASWRQLGAVSVRTSPQRSTREAAGLHGGKLRVNYPTVVNGHLRG